MSDGNFIHGPRVPVEFVKAGAGYSGPAAVDGNRVLFPARIKDVRGVKEGTVDGKPVRVVSIAQSSVVAALVELIVEPVNSAD